mmetsp:Transcript_69566/g.166538  ORF Transcript_69566/g.166538 Transcript_69566/m.166538 type:complete len:363 (-) Transcript_69566:1655-2743(-)
MAVEHGVVHALEETREAPRPPPRLAHLPERSVPCRVVVFEAALLALDPLVRPQHLHIRVPVVEVGVHGRAFRLHLAPELDHLGAFLERRERLRHHLSDHLTALLPEAFVAHHRRGCGHVPRHRPLHVHGHVRGLLRGREELRDVLLLHRIQPLPNLAEEPVGVRDPLDRVLDQLHGRGDRHDLLDCFPEAVLVVLPVEDGADVEGGVDHRGGVAPLAEQRLLGLLIGLEDLNRDRSFGDGRPLGGPRDDVGTVQTLVSDHVGAEKLRDAFRGGDGHRLAPLVLLHRLGHVGALGNEGDQLLVLQIHPLVVEDVEPVVGNVGHGLVALFEVFAVEEPLEHPLLEHFDELQLPAALQLKALELR